MGLRTDIDEDDPVCNIKRGERERKDAARISIYSTRQRYQSVDFNLVNIELRAFRLVDASGCSSWAGTSGADFVDHRQSQESTSRRRSLSRLNFAVESRRAQSAAWFQTDFLQTE